MLKAFCQLLSLNELALEQESDELAQTKTSDKNKAETEFAQHAISYAVENCHWLEMAETLTTKKLEEKVAEQNPKHFQKLEVRKPIGQSMESLTLRLDAEQIKKFERVKELLSSQSGRETTFLEGLDEMLDLFIEKKDPIKKALRAEKRKNIKKQTSNLNVEIKQEEAPPESVQQKSNLKVEKGENKSLAIEKPQIPAKPAILKNRENTRQPLSSALKHELYLRTGGQCCFKSSSGIRCNRRKWLHIHHKTPVSQGGSNHIENLDLLCSDHHRLHHFVQDHG